MNAVALINATKVEGIKVALNEASAAIARAQVAMVDTNRLAREIKLFIELDKIGHRIDLMAFEVEDLPW